MSLVTDLDDPNFAGVSFVDRTAGIFAAHGIMAALLARAKTQRGQFRRIAAASEHRVYRIPCRGLISGTAAKRCPATIFLREECYSLLDCDKNRSWCIYRDTTKPGKDCCERPSSII